MKVFDSTQLNGADIAFGKDEVLGRVVAKRNDDGTHPSKILVQVSRGVGIDNFYICAEQYAGGFFSVYRSDGKKDLGRCVDLINYVIELNQEFSGELNPHYIYLVPIRRDAVDMVKQYPRRVRRLNPSTLEVWLDPLMPSLINASSVKRGEYAVIDQGPHTDGVPRCRDLCDYVLTAKV